MKMLIDLKALGSQFDILPVENRERYHVSIREDKVRYFAMVYKCKDNNYV